jgi:thiol-disulfide isomerase/thioredoxin
MKKRGILLFAALLLLALLIGAIGAGKTAPAAPAATPVPAEETAAIEEQPAPAEETAAAEEQSAPADEQPDPADGQSASEGAEMALRFSTTAFDGSDVDESILTGAAVTMVNFFEPWCPPCIAELPELQRLYENYTDKGFNLIGVYSTEEGTAEVLEKAGIGYPVLRYVPAFDAFQTGYVPTTVFLDASGSQLGEPVIGARSYEQWEEIVKGLLG